MDYWYKVVGRSQEYPNDAETGKPVEDVPKELTPLIVEIYHNALNSSRIQNTFNLNVYSSAGTMKGHSNGRSCELGNSLLCCVSLNSLTNRQNTLLSEGIIFFPIWVLSVNSLYNY